MLVVPRRVRRHPCSLWTTWRPPFLARERGNPLIDVSTLVWKALAVTGNPAAGGIFRGRRPAPPPPADWVAGAFAGTARIYATSLDAALPVVVAGLAAVLSRRDDRPVVVDKCGRGVSTTRASPGW